jgi:hypothetical protein
MMCDPVIHLYACGCNDTEIKPGRYLQGKLGRKKVLAQARRRRSPVQSTRAAGSDAQVERDGSSVMTESERQSEIASYATLVMNWLRSTALAPCDWEPFFTQVDLALYGRFPWLFSENAPRLNEIRANLEPGQVIECCKPDSGSGVSMSDIINMHLDWLARWIQIVVPDRELMKEALGRAETILVREAWKTNPH